MLLLTRLLVDTARAWAYLDRPADFDHYFAAASAFAAGGSPFNAPGYFYPPLLALLLAPFVGAGYRMVRAGWLVVNAAAWSATGAVTWRTFGGGGGAAVAVGLAWALDGTLAVNLAMGQPTPLLLALAVMSCALWRRAPRVSGSLAGLAVAIKLWPGIVLLSALVTRRWRLLGAAALTVLSLLVLPATLLSVLRPPGRPQHGAFLAGTPAVLNTSLPAVALRLADPPQGTELPDRWVTGTGPGIRLARNEAALSMGVATLTVAVAMLGLTWGRGRNHTLVAVYGLLATVPLASPIAWYHYQILLLPAVALVVQRAAARRSWAAAVAALALLVAATWPHQLNFHGYLHRYGWTAASPWRLWLASGIVAAADAALLALVALEARRARAPER